MRQRKEKKTANHEHERKVTTLYKVSFSLAETSTSGAVIYMFVATIQAVRETNILNVQ